jgi:hypothetical protein
MIGKSSSRLVPAETANITIGYQSVNATTGVLNPTASVSVAVTPSATTATTVSEPLNDFAAGLSNTITVTALDSSSVAVASGSKALDVLPGSTSSVNITLATTTTSASISGIAAIPAVGSVPLTAVVTTPGGDISAAVNTANPGNLAWSISPAGLLATSATTGRSISLSSIAPVATSGLTATLNYLEYGQVVQTVTSTSFALSAPAFSAGVGTAIVDQGGAHTLAADLFDVSGDGSVLFYDATATPTGFVGTGAARIAPLATGFPIASDEADFDTATAATFVGTGSRMALSPSPAGNSAQDEWIVISSDGTTVDAFQRGYKNRAVTGTWSVALAAGTTALDVDAKGSNVYILETTGAGAYQVDTRSRTTGVATGSAQAITGLSFAPTAIAVILQNAGAETDIFLAGPSQIALFKETTTGNSLNLNFTGSTAVTPADIATAYDSTDATSDKNDPRFLFVLDHTGGANRVLVFNTLATTPAQLGPAIHALTGTASTNLAATKTSASTITVSVLDQSGGNTRVEQYTMQ